MEKLSVPLTSEQRAAHQTLYLKHLMPVQLLFRMLCCQPRFPHGWFYRSLGFSKRGYGAKQIYWRDKQRAIVSYESFLHHLRDFLPEQLHFGSLHCSALADATLQRRLHEVVLDVDLTDFVRHCGCGSASTACNGCWMHIEGAALLLRYQLCEVLGVPEQHLLWVFSG